MNRPRIPSFRGLRALIEHSAGPDRTALERRLLALGLQVSALEQASLAALEGFDVFFFDADRSPEADIDAGLATLPTVALIGSEAPGRLEALLARRPSAYLLKPIRSTGVYSCMAIALHHFAALQATRRRLHSAEERLRLRRTVFSALLRLMREADLDDAAAFRLLQRGAMSCRMTIEALSAEVVAGRVAPANLLGQAQQAAQRSRP